MNAAPALDGLLIADFSRVLAGPYATMTLADLGATVVKVERSGTGDDTRRWGPPWTSTSSCYFESVNRSKLGIDLDFGLEEDVAAARALAHRSDVVVENFLPGVLERFDLDYESVKRKNPRVVYCSITGWGAGAGADRPGYDFIAQAAGGLMSITGEDGGEAVKVGVALVDVLAGKDALIGILAALAARQRTGRGQRVEVNLLSSLLAALANQASSALATGVAPRRLGNRHPSIAPYETLRCADRPIAVAVGNDQQFRRFVDALSVGELADDLRFGTNEQRIAHRDALTEALERALAKGTAQEWSERLVRAGIAASVVGDILDGFRVAVELGLDPVADMGSDHAPQVRHPVRYSESRVVAPSRPPRLGEHRDQVLHWLNEGTAAPNRQVAP